MATRDEPPDPQQALAAAEAAHLAARQTVPVRPGDPAVRPTVRLDQPTVRLDRRRSRPAGAPLPLAAVVAAGWAAIVSFVPVAAVVMLLVLAELGPAGVVGPIQVAAAGWLLAHGVPLATPDGPLALAPLALAALAAWRVARAGVHVTRAIGGRGRRSIRQAVTAAVAVGLAYGGLGALAGAVAGGEGWGAPVARAGLTLAGFGLVAAGYGALRTTGLLAAWADRLPPAVPPGVRSGLLAAALVLAAGATLAGVSIAASGGAAADVLAAYGTDVAGQAGLTLLCLAFAPNLAVWAAAYLVGPGFAVGADTVVRSSEVTTGPLPVLPVFVGLPAGPLPTVGALLLVVPVLAGAVGGYLLATRAAGLGWARPLLAAVVCGGVAAATLGLLAAAAGGALGAGQLAQFGPDPLAVAGFTMVTVTAGALLGVVAGGLLTRWRRS